jgi:hypothetical protein
MATTSNPFEAAERISERIVDIITGELQTMKREDRIDTNQLVAGQLLAFLNLLKTAPSTKPTSVSIVELAIRVCLDDMKMQTTGAGVLNG